MIIFCCPRPRIAVRISDEHINTSITSRINHTMSYVPGRHEYSVYLLIPFGVPVHAEGAEIIPAGMLFFPTVLACTGFGKSTIPRDFTARERKTTGGQTFPRELFGWERDITISSGTVWMGSRERYLHGDDNFFFPVKSCGKFPAGFFPRKALGTVVALLG